MPMLNRRAIMAGISATGTAFALGGCATTVPAPPMQSLAAPLEPPVPTPSADIYGEVTGEPFPIPAVKLTGLDPTYLRTTVRYPGTEEPGTIVVDPPRRYLYLVQAGGSALRYGVGVGREGMRHRDHPRQAGMAGLVSTQGDDPAPTGTPNGVERASERARNARRPAQSARCSRDVSVAGQ